MLPENDHTKVLQGRVLAGRYQLTSILGEGGMGSVWRAHDRTLGVDVAIKMIDQRFVASHEALTRFHREARAAAALRSTYVVQVLDYGVDCETPFIAMELLQGESLGQRLAREGRLKPGQASLILTQVARALALAHERGFVHRDVKPENVFVCREGDEELAKVLDFGIARATPGFGVSGGLQTQTGTILGTPFYMSPEQASGQPVDALSDVWSFAVLAYECLTGRRAFSGDSIGALFHAICMAPLPVPSRVAEVPQGFDAWFGRAADRSCHTRYASIREAADALRLVCTGTLVGGLPALSSTDEPAAFSAPPVKNVDGALPLRTETFLAPQLGEAQVDADGASGVRLPNLDTNPGSAHSILVPARERKRARTLPLMAVALLGIIGYGGWQWLRPASVDAPSSLASSSASGAAVPTTPTAITARAVPSAEPVRVGPVTASAAPPPSQQPVPSSTASSPTVTALPPLAQSQANSSAGAPNAPPTKSLTAADTAARRRPALPASARSPSSTSRRRGNAAGI